MLPVVIYLLIVNIYPLIYVFGLSFTQYSLATTASPVFIWFKNFGSVLSNDRFWSSLKVTGLFSFFNVIVQVVLGFAVALLLNNLRWGRQFIVTLLLLPMMIAPAVVAFIWKMIYNPYWGPLNYLLQLIGIEGRSWASDPTLALPALMLADIWQWTPFTIILLLAGLQSLPRAVYEAAYIDGSSFMASVHEYHSSPYGPICLLGFYITSDQLFQDIRFDLYYHQWWSRNSD